MSWLFGALALAAIVFAMQANCRLFARAQDLVPLPVDEDEWNEHTALWLARAQVGEAGWAFYKDHDAIAWVLLRRWREAQAENQHATFARVIQQYCVSIKGTSARSAWLRQLETTGEKPHDWPAGSSWPAHKRAWMQVLDRAEMWADGLVEDPTGGRAWHFGSTDDPVPVGHVAIEGLGTQNIFYEPLVR